MFIEREQKEANKTELTNKVSRNKKRNLRVTQHWDTFGSPLLSWKSKKYDVS
jgi:hypothetical protein